MVVAIILLSLILFTVYLTALIEGIFFLNRTITEEKYGGQRQLISGFVFAVLPFTALLLIPLPVYLIIFLIPFYVSSNFIWLINFVISGGEDNHRDDGDDEPDEPNGPWDDFDGLRAGWEKKIKQLV